jgi:hypothetical protein
MQFIAKAFLEKDYKAIQAKKATLLPPAKQPEEDSTSRDVVMGNNEVMSPTAVILESDGDSVQPNLRPQASMNGHVTTEAPTLQNQLPQSDNITSSQNRNPSPPPVATNPPPSFPATDEEISFDSMFRDTADGTGSGLDITMAFGNDDSGNRTFLASNNAFDGSNDPNTNAKEIGSIGSLLPSLESYANAGGDEFNVEVQQSSTGATSKSNPLAVPGSGDGLGQGGAGGVEDATMEELPPAESNFDDQFISLGDFGGDGEDDLLDDIEIRDLDEWFT